MISAALIEWCGALGEVGTEWRFLITPPGEHDVLSHAALPGFTLALAGLFAKIDRPRLPQ